MANLLTVSRRTGRIAQNMAAGLSLLLLAAAGPVPAAQLPAGQAEPASAPYDAVADADAAVASAFARAAVAKKLVILDFGGNWCPDCRMLAGIFDLPPMRAWLAAHAETVMIDVGRMDRNSAIAARFGVKITAVPTVLMVTPDGRVLNPKDVFALADARHVSAQNVADLLAKWASQ